MFFSSLIHHRDGVQIAARNGSLDILVLLYESGASLHSRGSRGDTLFHLASSNGHVPILQWLTSVGVMHDSVDILGQTCAHLAARRGEVEVLRYLYYTLDMDLYQKDFDDQTPLDTIPKQTLRGNDKELEETRDFLMSLLESQSIFEEAS